MINIGIVGASGYTARELLLILQRHPHVNVVRGTSRQLNATPLAESHPGLAKWRELSFESFDVDDFVDAGVQCAFTCLPHAASAEIVKQLLQHDIKVVDFSADYRLNDVSTFENWYQAKHPDPDRVGSIPYGLPELFREKIKSANLVANPGCFPTSAILPLAPPLQDGLIETDNIIVDSKSGVSGAGRNPKPNLHYPEANESVAAYSIGTHRHAPEIEHLLKRSTNKDANITFTPHLIPMNRGILSTIYLQPAGEANIDTITESIASHYRDEPFIRLRDTPPRTSDVTHTNFCDIHVAKNRDNVILVSAIDNLVKGASGAAVQNFNLMFDFPETMGLV